VLAARTNAQPEEAVRAQHGAFERPTNHGSTSDVFIVSSRSRHTRCYRDWSSDVCSSDLPWLLPHNSGETYDAAGKLTLPIGSRETLRLFGLRSVEQRLLYDAAFKYDVRFAPARRVSGTLRSEERRVGKEGRSGGGAAR